MKKLTEDLLLAAGFIKRNKGNKPKVISVHQTCVTYCEIYERINGSTKEVITLQVVQKLPIQEDGERPSCNNPLLSKTSSPLPSIDVCSYQKILANENLPSSNNTHTFKLVLGLLRNKFISSVLAILPLEDSLAKLDSDLLTELLETGILLEEIPVPLLEEFLSEAQHHAVFSSPLTTNGHLGERSIISPAYLFSFSPSSSLQEVCS